MTPLTENGPGLIAGRTHDGSDRYTGGDQRYTRPHIRRGRMASNDDNWESLADETADAEGVNFDDSSHGEWDSNENDDELHGKNKGRLDLVLRSFVELQRSFDAKLGKITA
jgi:hypothetical protein